MSRPGLMPFMGLLMAMLLITGMPVEGWALPTWMQRGESHQQTPLASQAPSGRLQEVAPPGAVQQLRENLQRFQPNLRLITPTDDSVIDADSVELVLDVKDWPVSRDLELGLGPHVVVQIDNQPPHQFDELDGSRVSVRLDDLSPGSHRFSAWTAYPWGEAVKTPGANLQGRFHLWQRVEGTQPDNDAPWLVPVTNSAHSALQPMLLDWIIWNAPLQNLRDGDGRWRLRLSVDGDSFLVDQQEALWLKGNPSSRGNLVQMELLNGVGEPITPEFNNQLIHQSGPRTKPPTWLKAHLTEDELTRLSGAPRILSADLGPEAVAQPAPVLDIETKREAKPVETAGTVTESPKEDEAQPDSDLKPTPQAQAAPETETVAKGVVESEPIPKPNPNADALVDEQNTTREDTDESTFEQAPEIVSEDIIENPPPTEPGASDDQGPRLQPDKPSMPVPSASEERLIPTSRLGGSARELLNDDGSLRKP